VADCERVLRTLGFQVCRVRHYVTVARIEVAPAEISRLRQPEILSEVTRRFKDTGFTNVDVDPKGYRAGGLNSPLETFPQPKRPTSQSLGVRT
jgi:uncharacterized protein